MPVIPRLNTGRANSLPGKNIKNFEQSLKTAFLGFWLLL